MSFTLRRQSWIYHCCSSFGVISRYFSICLSKTLSEGKTRRTKYIWVESRERPHKSKQSRKKGKERKPLHFTLLGRWEEQKHWVGLLLFVLIQDDRAECKSHWRDQCIKQVQRMVLWVKCCISSNINLKCATKLFKQLPASHSKQQKTMNELTDKTLHKNIY